jgi:antitoxin FitA
MRLTLDNIPPELNAALHRKAAEQHKPVDQIALDAMKAGLALAPQPGGEIDKPNLVVAIRARFGPLGGIEMAEPIREPMRDPPDFKQ